MKEITEELFKATQAKYPPNAWIKLSYKYFSVNTTKENLYVRNIVLISLVTLFIIGFLCTVLSVANLLIMFVTLSYTLGLLLLGLFISIAVIMNNFRIRKIRKELELDRFTYDMLVSYFE